MAAGVAAAFAIPAIGARFSASTTVTIKVTATEYKFALSKRSVSPGTTVTFKVTNKGKLTHNFKILGKKTPLIQPGKTATLKVVFKKKGKFGFLCRLHPVRDHEPRRRDPQLRPHRREAGGDPGARRR